MTERYVKEIRGNMDPVLDEIFDYELFPQAGIPWEAGEFVLGMWAYDEEMAAFKERGMRSRPDGFMAGRAAIQNRATMRKAKLWWKVHQAVPNEFPKYSAEHGREMKRQDFIYFECEFLWTAEFSTHVLGNPIDVSANWAYLAYRPWEVANLPKYERAVSEGRVKPKVDGIGTLYNEHGEIVSISLAPSFNRGGYQKLPASNQ
jgi:hypothetical protein